MMTRVGGQLQSDSYESILRQTEQDQRQPANPSRIAPPPPPQLQQPPNFQSNPEFSTQYNPNVPDDTRQPPPNFAAKMGPWAGMPGTQPAFELPAAEMQYPPPAHGMDWGLEPQAPRSRPASFMQRYRDWLLVALVVFILYMYCVPQLGRFLPSIFQHTAGQPWPTAALALLAGGAYHGLDKHVCPAR